MENSGYHVVDGVSRTGRHVEPFELDRADPVSMAIKRPYAYDQCVYGTVPEEGRTERYFYTHDDIMYLEGVIDPSEDDLKKLKSRLRANRIRYRVDRTTKTRGFYLFDMLTSMWLYLTEKPGARIDEDLIAEAKWFRSDN